MLTDDSDWGIGLVICILQSYTTDVCVPITYLPEVLMKTKEDMVDLGINGMNDLVTLSAYYKTKDNQTTITMLSTLVFFANAM